MSTKLSIFFLSLLCLAALFYLFMRKKPGAPAAAPKRIIRVSVDDAVENFICAVVGESFANEDGSQRQDIIRRLGKVGMQATLEREPDNQYDSNAVAVYIADQQIGYLKTEVAERLADKIDGGRFVAGAVIHAITGGTKSKPHFGVTLNLTVYLIR